MDKPPTAWIALLILFGGLDFSIQDINITNVSIHTRLVAVIQFRGYSMSSSVVRRHASELIPGFVTFVGDEEPPSMVVRHLWG